jgi:hypothetical protein
MLRRDALVFTLSGGAPRVSVLPFRRDNCACEFATNPRLNGEARRRATLRNRRRRFHGSLPWRPRPPALRCFFLSMRISRQQPVVQAWLTSLAWKPVHGATNWHAC